MGSNPILSVEILIKVWSRPLLSYYKKVNAHLVHKGKSLVKTGQTSGGVYQIKIFKVKCSFCGVAVRRSVGSNPAYILHCFARVLELVDNTGLEPVALRA